ncbi:hypothetical protein JW835_11795 [bacterium]|nr:hypothetical protein [bacterium]
MIKKIEEIEQLLRDEKLPDQNINHLKTDIWQKIIQGHHVQTKRRSFLFHIKPWLWTLASILLILVCLFLMWLMNGSR